MERDVPHPEKGGDADPAPDEHAVTVRGQEPVAEAAVGAVECDGIASLEPVQSARVIADHADPQLEFPVQAVPGGDREGVRLAADARPGDDEVDELAGPEIQLSARRGEGDPYRAGHR